MQLTPQLTKLRDVIASLYPLVPESQQVIQEAGYVIYRICHN